MLDLVKCQTLQLVPNSFRPCFLHLSNCISTIRSMWRHNKVTHKTITQVKKWTCHFNRLFLNFAKSKKLYFKTTSSIYPGSFHKTLNHRINDGRKQTLPPPAPCSGVPLNRPHAAAWGQEPVLNWAQRDLCLLFTLTGIWASVA